MADDRAKHSVIYAESTSEIKDDTVALIACFVRNLGHGCCACERLHAL